MTAQQTNKWNIKDTIQTAVIVGSVVTSGFLCYLNIKLEMQALHYEIKADSVRIDALEKKNVSYYEKNLFDKYAVLPKKEDEIKTEN